MLEKLVEIGIKKGLSEVEVYSVESNILSFTISNNMVKEASRSRITNIGLRGAAGRKTGGITLTTLNIEPEKAVSELVGIVNSSPEDPYWPGFPPLIRRASSTTCLDRRITNISDEEALKLLLNTMEALRGKAMEKHVEKAIVVEGSLNLGTQKIRVLNLHGVDASSECTFINMWLTLSVESPSGSSDKSMFIAKRGLDESYILKRAEETGELATLFTNSGLVESGVYDLILAPEAAGLIISTVLTPAFSALNILESRSPLKDKTGKQVASPQVSIMDDPLIPLELGSRGFDDEGVGTYSKIVVDKGVFKQPLHSYYTASRMSTETTGNGFRRSPGSPVQPGATNLILQPVKGDLNSFINEAGRALVVYEMIGYWMSNPVNGVVKATVSHGLLVEKGRVIQPVKGVVISGNIYEWLNNGLVGVGGDLVVNDGVGSPSLWIHGVNVAGK